MGTVCVALVACAWIEQPGSYFANRREAENAKMFATGWLPKWLPASSKNLREKHDIDTNASILRFEYDTTKETAPFSNSCKPLHPALVELPRLSARWWPDNKALLLEMPAAYRCCDEDAYLAIPAEGGTAYFWRISA
jgi:hypothetical protein